MDKNKKNIDQFFLEQLAGAREQPPASVWERLEEKLKEHPPERRASGKGFIASIALLIVAVGGIAYLWSGGSLPGQHQAGPALVASKGSSISGLYDAAEHHTAVPEAVILDTAPEAGKAAQQHIEHQEEVARIAANTGASAVEQHNKAKRTVSSVPEIPSDRRSTAKAVNSHITPVPAHHSSTIGDRSLKGSVAVKAGKRIPFTGNPVQPERAFNTPVEPMVTGEKIANDRSTAEVPELNKDRITSDHTAQDHAPEIPDIIDQSSEAIVFHKVAFKGSSDTSNAAQGKYIPEQNAAANYTIESIEPAVATVVKASGEKETRGKVARLSEKKMQQQVAVKLPPAQKMTVAEEQKIRKSLNLFLGIKAGYETGFSSFTSGKYVGSVFGEVQLSDRWSFLLQPGIKVAQLNRTLIQAGNYFQAGATTSRMFNVRGDDSAGYTYDYAYRQTYDSIIASVEMKKNFTELELPLFLRYKINQQFSVMAGVNFTFGKLVLWNNKLQTISGLTITDTVLNTADSVAPAASAKFAHPGSTSFAEYKPLTLPANTSPMRFGYSLGLSYTLREQLMIDLLMQQNLSGYSSLTEPGIRQIFSQAYFRLSVGYKLFGTRK
ncbi:PorT family protein [Edaphocola aurantiacus]|uniref:PorT family protein n=1 Tax=Edaphocola aurantiacus TaxID=2601682 RepID=UPI001C987C55|nr:PorT family protein [Edaphocola aurantiacus]